MVYRTTLLAIAATSLPAAAHADDARVDTTYTASDARHGHTWLVVEAPMAVDASSTSQQAAMPAAGVYADNGRGALGLRMRVGTMPSSGTTMATQDKFATAGVALRFGVRASWVELVYGVGATVHDVAPAIEAGVGWSFSIGAVDVGPSVRYMRFDGRDSMTARSNTVLFGADLYFGKQVRHARAPELAVAAAAPAADHVHVPQAAAPPATDPDCTRDCDHQLEQAIENGLVEVDRDRIIVDQRAVFDDKDELQPEGRAVIAAIGHRWQQHPEWHRMRIVGHVDVLGSDADNQSLSASRATRASTVLVDHGYPAARLEVVGVGRTQRHAVEDARERNQWLEFVGER